DPTGALGDQPGLEGPGPIPRRVEPDRADLGRDRLGGRPVPGVRRATPGGVALLVADMVGQLRLQPPLEHSLDETRQEPALAGQLQLPGTDTGHELIEQTSVDELINRSLLSAPADIVIGHRGHLTTSLDEEHLHRPSDTPARGGSPHTAPPPAQPRPLPSG